MERDKRNYNKKKNIDMREDRESAKRGEMEDK